MIFVGLAEGGFVDLIPEWVLTKLRDYFSGFPSSKPVEELFRVLRKAERENNDSKELSRSSRWYCAAQAAVLTEHDRPQVSVTTAAQQAAHKRAPPVGVYDPESRPFSMDDGSLDSLRAGWSGRAPSTTNMMPLAWLGLMQAKDDLQQATKHWLSLLASPSMLVCNRAMGVMGMVLFSCQFGLLLWKVIIRMCAERMVVVMDVGGGSTWQFVAIHSLSGWMAVEVEVVPVGEYLQWCVAAGVRGTPHCLAFRRKNQSDKKLLQLAAESAFPGMLLPHLRKLYNELEVNLSRKPQTERMFVDSLVRHALPGLPEDEYQRILKLRFEPEPAATTSLLEDEENMVIAQDMFDEAEAKHVVEPAIDKLKANRSKAGSCVARPPGSANSGVASSCSSGVAGQLRQRLPNPDAAGEYTVDQVRAMLPAWQPTSLSRERQWHSRWRVSCPNKAKTSATFGGKRSEQQAVAHIVQFVWKVYIEAHPGAACPWLFD